MPPSQSRVSAAPRAGHAGDAAAPPAAAAVHAGGGRGGPGGTAGDSTEDVQILQGGLLKPQKVKLGKSPDCTQCKARKDTFGWIYPRELLQNLFFLETVQGHL